MAISLYSTYMIQLHSMRPWFKWISYILPIRYCFESVSYTHLDVYKRQEIDSICSIALENGSYGSRLTGAGWGGCTVHLVPGGPNGSVERVKKALIEQFYKVRYPGISDEILEEVIIVSKPALGSCLYELED